MKIFIGAHLDDIEIGCGAYLSYLNEKNETNNIKCIVLSEGLENNSIKTSKKRREAFEINMEKLNIKEENYTVINHRIDTHFHEHYNELKFYLNDLLKNILNETKVSKEESKEGEKVEIFFHKKDNHNDHTIINNLVKEIFRPFYVDRLIEFEIPSSNLYNTDLNMNFNFIYDESIKNKKQELLDSYKNISLFETNDSRDINFTIYSNQYYGKMIQEKYIERYNIVFEKSRDI